MIKHLAHPAFVFEGGVVAVYRAFLDPDKQVDRVAAAIFGFLGLSRTILISELKWLLRIRQGQRRG